MSTTPSSETTFPFLELPSELRNMVYTLCVTYDNEIYVGKRLYAHPYLPCGNVIYVNRQVNREASATLYSKNKVSLLEDMGTLRKSPSVFKAQTYTGGGMTLRSSRIITTAGYSGAIHRHILRQFSDIELRLRCYYNNEGRRRSDRAIWASVKDIIEVICGDGEQKKEALSKTFTLSFDTSHCFIYKKSRDDAESRLAYLNEIAILELLKELSKVRQVVIKGCGDQAIDFAQRLSNALCHGLERES